MRVLVPSFVGVYTDGRRKEEKNNRGFFSEKLNRILSGGDLGKKKRGTVLI